MWPWLLYGWGVPYGGVMSFIIIQSCSSKIMSHGLLLSSHPTSPVPWLGLPWDSTSFLPNELHNSKGRLVLQSNMLNSEKKITLSISYYIRHHENRKWHEIRSISQSKALAYRVSFIFYYNTQTIWCTWKLT